MPCALFLSKLENSRKRVTFYLNSTMGWLHEVRHLVVKLFGYREEVIISRCQFELLSAEDGEYENNGWCTLSTYKPLGQDWNLPRR